jgi:hypothetical protein
VSRSPEVTRDLPRQPGESHFGRYSCPHSKSPEARSPEVTRDCTSTRRKSLREIFMPKIQNLNRSPSKSQNHPEVTRGCHVNREKVTSGDFHPNIPKSRRVKSRSDVRLTTSLQALPLHGCFSTQHMALIHRGCIAFISGYHVTLGPYHSGSFSCFTIQNSRSPKCRSVEDTWHSSISSCDNTMTSGHHVRFGRSSSGRYSCSAFKAPKRQNWLHL